MIQNSSNGKSSMKKPTTLGLFKTVAPKQPSYTITVTGVGTSRQRAAERGTLKARAVQKLMATVLLL